MSVEAFPTTFEIDWTSSFMIFNHMGDKIQYAIKRVATAAVEREFWSRARQMLVRQVHADGKTRFTVRVGEGAQPKTVGLSEVSSRSWSRCPVEVGRGAQSRLVEVSSRGWSRCPVEVGRGAQSRLVEVRSRSRSWWKCTNRVGCPIGMEASVCRTYGLKVCTVAKS
jgi:hypothetical protein